MGCDIHTIAERQVNGKWEIIPDLHPFDWRSYSMFGFLADVRNYSKVPPIAPARGLPEGCSELANLDDEHWLGEHSFSWLSLEELFAFDYDATFEDRRYTVPVTPNFWNGGATAEPGNGSLATFRDFLGTNFFADLDRLKAAGAERIVFGFDS